MPILLSLCFEWWLGSACARLATRPMPGTAPSWPSVLFALCLTQACLLTPAWTAMYCLSPSYALLYRFDPAVYAWVGQTAVVSALWSIGAWLVALGGYETTRRLRARKLGRTQLRLLSGCPALFALILLLLFAPRVFEVGTYDAFWTREAEPIWHHPIVLIVWASVGLSALVPSALRRFGRLEL